MISFPKSKNSETIVLSIERYRQLVKKERLESFLYYSLKNKLESLLNEVDQDTRFFSDTRRNLFTARILLNILEDYIKEK